MGGPQVLMNSCCQAGCQGQWLGRCSTSRRAEWASRGKDDQLASDGAGGGFGVPQ